MHVKIYGGPLSISYNLGKSLRNNGMDVVFYADRTTLDDSYRPVWEDRGLEPSETDWMKEVDVKLSNCIFRRKNEREFITELKSADILHMYGESCIWASFTDVPYVYHSYGYDLDQMPFKTNSPKDLILAYLLKRSILKAKCVIIAPHQKKILKRLKLNVREEYYPCPVDTEKYKKRPTALKDKLRKKGNCDFIFFSPTRHEWTHSHTSNKGNDRVINAFARFTKSSKKRALLVLVEKGDDLEKSKALVKHNGLENYIMWIKPQDKENLIEFYSASDIVFDQVVLGSRGQLFLESMSCGIPTFIYLKGYDAFYEELPPCVNVSTESEIFEHLMKLTENPGVLADIGNRSREWAVKYHDQRVVAERYKNLYKNILEHK